MLALVTSFPSAKLIYCDEEAWTDTQIVFDGARVLVLRCYLIRYIMCNKSVPCCRSCNWQLLLSSTQKKRNVEGDKSKTQSKPASSVHSKYQHVAYSTSTAQSIGHCRCDTQVFFANMEMTVLAKVIRVNLKGRS